MTKSLILLAIAIIVAGTMAFLLIFFLKRLKRIEKELWEEKSRKAEIAIAKRKEQLKLEREKKKQQEEGEE